MEQGNNNKKNENSPCFFLKHFEISPFFCNFALEIRIHFEGWTQIIVSSRESSMSEC